MVLKLKYIKEALQLFRSTTSLFRKEVATQTEDEGLQEAIL